MDKMYNIPLLVKMSLTHDLCNTCGYIVCDYVRVCLCVL